MPSQEDYLDNLLKDLDAMGLNETASDIDILNEGNAILEQMDLPFDDELFADMPEEKIQVEDAEENILENIPLEENQEEIVLADALSEESISLDNIPDELFAMTEEPIDIEVLDESDDGDSMEVGDFASMSEEEIEKIIAIEQEAGQESSDISAVESAENMDLMDILEQAEDGDLQEIHELLQKSDNNEAIDDSLSDMSEEMPQDYMALLDEISGESDGESDGISEKEKKAQERRAKKEERKAAKEAQKQARREAKLEAKAAKEAKKEQLLQPEENVEIADDMPEQIQPVAEDDLADIEALLNLAGAENASSEEALFGMAEEPVLPFATEDAIPSVDDILQTEESFVVVEKKNAKDTTKKGWFAKLVDFITEEDEEEEIDRGNEDVQISDENREIIDKMDKKKKKKKKGTVGKGKGDEEKEGATEGENAEENADKEKDKKPKKQKKAKKEKIPADLLEDPGADKKKSNISFKKVMPIILICLSIGLVIVLLSNLAGDFSAKRAGRKAYYEGDYQSCYQNLYGKELNESEQVMYGKSESILRMRLWFREYELLVEEGAEPEALDSLLESVKNYPKLYSYASEWNAGTEVSEIYTKMLTVLSEKYRLTEEQALEIANTKDDVTYSKMVYIIADGGSFGSWDEQPEVEIEESLRDVLPEEEELDDVLFLENSGK